jgi:hypothetical protein
LPPQRVENAGCFFASHSVCKVRVFFCLPQRVENTGCFLPLEGAGEKIVGDFALAGTERVCVFCDLFAFSVLQFPDVGVVLTDGAVG